jgi:hypothetical protein
MSRVTQAITIVLICVAALMTAMVIQAADENKMSEGSVVSAGSGKLVIKNDKNQEQTYSVDSSAKVTVDGKMAKLEDLKKDTKVSVTLDGDKVMSITSTDPMKVGA